MTAGTTSTTQLLKTDGSTVSATTEISSSQTGTASLYYNSTSSTYANLTNTSNYGTGSSSSKTMQGIKLTGGTTMTITLNSKTFSKMDVIYCCASSDAGKTLTIDGTDYTPGNTSIHKASSEKSFSTSITITNRSNKEFRVFVILTESSGGGSTYTVTYNGNGNTGGTAPSDASSPYAAGSNVTVLGNTGSLVKTGYTFDGWNAAANGSGTNYAVDATISSIAANTTLYAKWTCAATVPGNISKGSACAGEDLTLTSAGSPETGDTWYWQASSSGTATTNSGATYDVSSAGTYYIRSYNGTCWSAAKSVTVAAGNWTSPTISGASSVTVGNTITLTGSPSGGSWESSDETKATVNSSGVVSGVAIGNTNITYTKDGCTSDNHAVTVSAACTDPDLTITLN